MPYLFAIVPLYTTIRISMSITQVWLLVKMVVSFSWRVISILRDQSLPPAACYVDTPKAGHFVIVIMCIFIMFRVYNIYIINVANIILEVEKLEKIYETVP